MKLQQFFLFVLTFIFLSCAKEEIKVFQEDLPDDAFLISAVSNNPGEVTIDITSKYTGEMTIFWGTSPDDLCNTIYPYIDFWSSDTYSFNCKLILSSGKYYFKATLEQYDDDYNSDLLFTTNVVSCDVYGEHQFNNQEWVDLGLPSGLKWATCNIGASSPEDPGDYFAWGETSPKEKYTSDNCKTYNENIGDISGDKYYDAATVNWGDRWRMPTIYEFEELQNNCSFTMVEGEYSGCLVTSKNNGNSIFLPACGRRLGSHIYDNYVECNYWSSSLHMGIDDYSEYACYLQFSPTIDWHFADRCFGMPIRAVTE